MSVSDRIVLRGLRALAPGDSADTIEAVARRAFAAVEGFMRGTTLIALIDAVCITVGLLLLSVPGALGLGALVFVGAYIPYLGAFLGGIPAVLVALVFGSSVFESNTTTAILTVVAYVLIQQLEGNFLTPRIQGQALHVHPIVVLLAVIAGGEVAGLAGIIFAVPALAVFSVLFDFFRARLRRA